MCKKLRLKSIVGALVVALCLVSAGQAVEPVAHWTFDEVLVVDANDPNDSNATMSIVPDVSGNGYDGILQSKVVVSANDPNDPNATMEIVIESPADAVDPLIEGGVLVCDSNGFVEIPVEAWNDNIFEGYTVSFSILIPELMGTIPMAAKMWREDGSEVRNFGCHAPWSNGRVYFDTTPVPIAAGGNARYQRINTGNISDQIIGKWVTYFFVYEPGRQEIYLNGELVASGTGTGAIYQDTTVFSIGANADGMEGFIGSMDDVRLYDVALTVDEIQDAMGIPVDPDPNVVTLMVFPITSLELDDPNDDDPNTHIMATAINGVGVDTLVLGTTTADPDTQERVDNFDVSQDSDYARRDSENFVTTMFDVPVSVIYILEKDGQDGGYVEALNAEGGTISDRLDFTGDDFSKTPSSQWIIGGMMVIADMPVNGIRIWSTGIDVQSVSGIPVL